MSRRKSSSYRAFPDFEAREAERLRQERKEIRDSKVQRKFDVLRRGERHGMYSLYQVFKLVGQKPDYMSDKLNLDGHEVEVNSLRLMVFKLKGTTCEDCGVVGSFFVVERFPGNKTFSLHCYGYNHNGDERRITIDHYIPKKFGGGDEMWNLQPRCDVCNVKKGHRIPKEYQLEFD